MKGYLDVGRWLCESGGAAEVVDGVRGVDARSKGGWTPLSELCSLCLSSNASATKVVTNSERFLKGPLTCSSLPSIETVGEPTHT